MDAKAEVIADLLKEYQAHKRIIEKLAIQLEALGADLPEYRPTTLNLMVQAKRNMDAMKRACDRENEAALRIVETATAN